MAADVFTTGINSESGDPGVTFSNVGVADITIIDSSGRRINNDTSGPVTAVTAYIEFDFANGFYGMTSATTGWVWIVINRSRVNHLANTITLSAIGGTGSGSLSSASTVALVGGGDEHRYKIHFTLTAALDVETITFQFDLESNSSASIDIDTVGTPEPSTLALFGLGLLGTGIFVRRRRRKAA